MNRPIVVKSRSWRRIAAFILAVLLLISYEPQITQVKQPSLAEADEYYSKDYKFSEDWFTQYIPIWKKILAPFKDKPEINYLEIGVYEGRSLIWMLENVLTHSTSKATCIDIFPGDLKEKFLTNLKLSGFKDKVTIITGRSQIELRYLPINSFDIIYIDASHNAGDVLADAVLSWSLLKDGGLLIFDDYLYKTELPIELRPKFAIDAFMTAYGYHIEVVHQDYQVILRKREIPDMMHTFIGQYVYVWGIQKLYRSGLGFEVELSDTEKELIETLISSKEFNENKRPDDEMLKNEAFIDLTERINLNFVLK